MKLASLIKENIDVYDFLKQNREQIELDHGNQTYRMLQVSLMMDEEAYVRNWLIKNGYMDEEKLPFEEMKLSGEKNAEELAAKTKQIASKAGEEMVNFAKDVYDTPTVKRLRAYITVSPNPGTSLLVAFSKSSLPIIDLSLSSKLSSFNFAISF